MAGSPRLSALPSQMIAFYITIPLMALAVAVAVLPVLLGSIRHHRAMLQRRLETPQSVAQEANFWHHILGHCTAEDFVPTPDFVADSEVARVGVSEERRASEDQRFNADPTSRAAISVGAER